MDPTKIQRGLHSGKGKHIPGVLVRYLPALWFFLGLGLRSLGQTESWPSSSYNYLINIWDTENNLPGSTVTDIAQTPDGYLWVGTYDGLARFDGANFVTFDSANTPELTQTRVQGLYLDTNGTLWINTFRGGLTSYRRGVFRKEWPDQPTFNLHTSLVDSSPDHVTFVTQFGEVLEINPNQKDAQWQISAPPQGARPIYQCTAGDHQLWFLGRDGHILRYFGGKFSGLADNGGLAGRKIYTLVSDTHGQVWVGAQGEIAVWDGVRFCDETPTNGNSIIEPQDLFPVRSGAIWVWDGPRLKEMLGRKWVDDVPRWNGLLGPASGRSTGVHEDRDGGLWLNHYGNGLFHITPQNQFERLTMRNGLPGDRVGAWYQSSDGSIWAGVDHGGLVQLRPRQFHVIGTAQGLPVRTALSVCENKGVVWVGTAGGGLCCWQHGTLTTYPVGDNASANFVFSIYPKASGGAWISAGEGEDLYEFTNGVEEHAPLEVHGIKSLLEDSKGRLWMGTKAGVTLGMGQVRQFLSTNDQGIPLPAIRALVEAPDGKIWAGSDDGTLFLCQPGKLTPFRAQDDLSDQPIYSMTVDAEGTLWIGTFRGGLLRFRDGVFKRIGLKQGLPADFICQVLDDGRGRLWLGTHQGIFSIAKAQLNAVADGQFKKLDYVIYGRHDGLPSLECSDGYQPACWRASDGMLWFTTARGVVSLNPNGLPHNQPAPPVHIEEVRVDDQPENLGNGELIVEHGSKQLDFLFTAVTFDAGTLARFRYRVDGLDSDWVDIGTRRIVQLRNLPPQAYCFRVIACNREGVWNTTGATLKFRVLPFFYQTWWFRFLLAAFGIGAVVFAARRAATRKYRRKLAFLEKQRAVELDRARIAKDIHDDIGAGLTQITLLTELARRDPAQTDANLGRITESARHLTKAMDEIVWAVDPQHDTLAGLMDYVSAYAEDYLRLADVRCRMDLPVEMADMRVDAELRYNLFLALKEALNNIVKHAQATEVWLRLRTAGESITLVVEDNGRGIQAVGSGEEDRLNSGSGLGNLGKRLAAVGGHCSIQSLPGSGTSVSLTVYIQARSSPKLAMQRGGFPR